MNGAGYWRRLGLDWLVRPRQRLWRRYHDRAVADWVRANLPSGPRRVLKTDLFEEAVGEALLPALATEAPLAVGVDLALPLAAAVRRSGHGRAAVADVLCLPFADGCLDLVVSTSTLDHFERLESLTAALGELARVLRPGGTLLLTLDNLDNPVVRLRNRLVRSRIRAFGLVPYRVGATTGRRRLVEMLRHAGFRVTRTTAVVHAPRALAIPLCARAEGRWGPAGRGRLLAGLAVWERLARWPTRYLTGYYLAVVARRARAPEPPAPGSAVPR